nr:endonuclease/exonuclease/phosphatase family protein [Sulfitobacter litoralis]
MATFNTELSRAGPGLLLRDLAKGSDPQISAVMRLLANVSADVIVLQGIDYDLDGTTLGAFADVLGASGPVYPHRFALPPNAGRPTGLDMDGDGQTGGARDGQGYGRFFGAGAMAILSRYPVLNPAVQDHTAFLWRDLPDALLPRTKNGPFPSDAVQQVQRLASHGAWVVPIAIPDQAPVTLLTFYATPPVFDGPEDRNGKRNHDEILFWDHYLAGTFGPLPNERFVLLGDANLDPTKGEGLKVAIQTLLGHPALQDPLADQPTVTFDSLGDMRVDYLLPSTDWRVVAAGVARDPAASRHGLVWADLDR